MKELIPIQIYVLCSDSPGCYRNILLKNRLFLFHFAHTLANADLNIPNNIKLFALVNQIKAQKYDL